MHAEVCTATVTPTPASPRDSSSSTRMYERKSAPAPPYSSGTQTPISPSSPSDPSSLAESRAHDPTAEACGSISALAKSRARDWIHAAPASARSPRGAHTPVSTARSRLATLHQETAATTRPRLAPRASWSADLNRNDNNAAAPPSRMRRNGPGRRGDRPGSPRRPGRPSRRPRTASRGVVVVSVEIGAPASRDIRGRAGVVASARGQRERGQDGSRPILTALVCPPWTSSSRRSSARSRRSPATSRRPRSSRMPPRGIARTVPARAARVARRARACWASACRRSTAAPARLPLVHPGARGALARGRRRRRDGCGAHVARARCRFSSSAPTRSARSSCRRSRVASRSAASR